MDNRKLITFMNGMKKMKKISQQYVETIDGEKIILQGKSYAIDVNRFKFPAFKKMKLYWYLHDLDDWYYDNSYFELIHSYDLQKR